MSMSGQMELAHDPHEPVPMKRLCWSNPFAKIRVWRP